MAMDVRAINIGQFMVESDLEYGGWSMYVEVWSRRDSHETWFNLWILPGFSIRSRTLPSPCGRVPGEPLIIVPLLQQPIWMHFSQMLWTQLILVDMSAQSTGLPPDQKLTLIPPYHLLTICGGQQWSVGNYCLMASAWGRSVIILIETPIPILSNGCSSQWVHEQR